MAKNIIICADGTNNEIAGDQTNVLRLFRMLVNDQEQLVYYDAGVGTHADPTAQWSFSRLIQKRLDAAIGTSVRENVLDAYRFLMNHYSDGDQIFFFGFSRGAYTVRALAGMIFRCGLLYPSHQNLANYAWSIFSDEDRTGNEKRKFGGTGRIKKVFGRNILIHFVGVWDTVSTFGWIWDLLTVPNSDKNKAIVHFRQALSIDERRACFEPILFQASPDQDAIEVWFPGVHADVGGGYDENEGGLSRISLEWMLDESVKFGLKIDAAKVKEQLIRIGGSDCLDPFAIQHDESQKFGWLLQGILPKRIFCRERKYLRWHWPNLAKRRVIPDNAFIHESVNERMGRSSLNYTPTLPKFYTIVPYVRRI